MYTQKRLNRFSCRTWNSVVGFSACFFDLRNPQIISRCKRARRPDSWITSETGNTCRRALDTGQLRLNSLSHPGFPRRLDSIVLPTIAHTTSKTVLAEKSGRVSHVQSFLDAQIGTVTRRSYAEICCVVGHHMRKIF